MFDSEFDDLGSHTPTQFPKTDINFYMMANNSSALEPWNKTSYKLKPDDFNQFSKQRIMKRRNLSFDSYEKAIRIPRKKLKSDFKHQVTLSTLTFYLSADANNSTQKKIKRKSSINSVVKSRKNIVPATNSKQIEPSLMMEVNTPNRGFTNSLRHTNLLKLKQEHQNKVKQIITKKDMCSNRTNCNMIKLNKFERWSDIEGSKNLPISMNNIILDEEPRVTTYDYLRKPKKVSFVGIRKILHMSNQKDQ